MTATLYDILGIDKAASQDEVRKAFKQKALETHPDKLDRDASEEEKQDAEARFRDVREAFEILNDPQERRSYDIRASIQADYKLKWAHLGEKQANMMKDREEWARKSQERYQARMEARREQARRAREAMNAQKQEDMEYQAMVDKMLQELCAQNPEWEERKKMAHRRKAEKPKVQGMRQPLRP